MTRHPLQSYIDAPLADPVKLYLPQGKRPAKRARKPQYEDGVDCPKLTRKELDRRAEKALSAKHDKLLEYYATTDLPNERIAEHLGLSVERVAGEMSWRRRVK